MCHFSWQRKWKKIVTNRWTNSKWRRNWKINSGKCGVYPQKEVNVNYDCIDKHQTNSMLGIQ